MRIVVKNTPARSKATGHSSAGMHWDTCVGVNLQALAVDAARDRADDDEVHLLEQWERNEEAEVSLHKGTSILGRSYSSEPKKNPIVWKVSRSRSSCFSTPPQGTGCGEQGPQYESVGAIVARELRPDRLQRGACCAAVPIADFIHRGVPLQQPSERLRIR